MATFNSRQLLGYRNASNRIDRRGLAVVELAVCLPLLVLIVFATIETCSMMHLRQSLKITAYEGARIGVVPEATSLNVEFQCSSLLDGRNIKGYTIVLDPANPASLNEGDFFQVSIRTDYSANSLLGSWFFADKTVTQACAMRRN